MYIIGITADTSISSTCTQVMLYVKAAGTCSNGIVIPYCAHLYYTVRCMRRWYTFYELVHTTHTHILIIVVELIQESCWLLNRLSRSLPTVSTDCPVSR